MTVLVACVVIRYYELDRCTAADPCFPCLVRSGVAVLRMLAAVSRSLQAAVPALKDSILEVLKKHPDQTDKIVMPGYPLLTKLCSRRVKVTARCRAIAKDASPLASRAESATEDAQYQLKRSKVQEIQGWLARCATEWEQGQAITVAQMDEGYNMVYRICTESLIPIENEMYIVYLDYVRGICDQFKGKKRRAAVSALQRVFSYLDKTFTNAEGRPEKVCRGAVRSKQPTSKLWPGQGLKAAAEAIMGNPDWIPDYQCPPPIEAALIGYGRGIWP